MSLAPIDFGLGGWKQEIPGTFNPRTGKVEYPKPEIFGRMAGKVFSGDPEDFESAFSVATHDKPFSRYPAAGGSDRWPGMSTDDIKRYVHPSTDPLLNIPITPFGMQARGGNPFSTDALDKQKQIQDYLNNDQKIRDLLIRQGKMKAGGESLFPIIKDLPGEVKGIRRGVFDFDERNLKNQPRGMRKAGMLFDNEGLFSA